MSNKVWDGQGHQFYVFPFEGMIMAEHFGPDGTHTTAVTPHDSVEAALAWFERSHPGAVVDELLPTDYADALRYETHPVYA